LIDVLGFQGDCADGHSLCETSGFDGDECDGACVMGRVLEVDVAEYQGDCSDDGGSKHMCNVCRLLPGCSVQHPRTQPPSSLTLSGTDFKNSWILAPFPSARRYRVAFGRRDMFDFDVRVKPDLCSGVTKIVSVRMRRAVNE
jgi:hypothetical protein